ncbi:ABC transporter substrate-binding protein [Desulfovibrio gilichinskyi]|uniref:Amino acid/amide ABC transporter substrate-binding protein, HAAT family n=1 Tax=Desulfovibrio gilichinskyi TaxID=1519643 RepID=A0A1X7CP13_9BACT|nr:ABC transporter substrate-binding protein [Desulfovibrio gilichinskyi]SMF00300.1 amino acid/amide ABC transporter substrate-binding protein, HAAT family [Desulfovibrio gilichinskyi]
MILENGLMISRPNIRCLPFLWLAVLMMFFLWGCSGDKGKESPKLKVGIIAVTSGELFRKGSYVVAATRYAADKVNAEGGIDISGVNHLVELYPADSKGAAEVATQLALRLIDKEKVSVIVGGVSSSVALAIAAVCEEKKVPFITPVASSTELTKFKYSFRVSYTNYVQAAAIASFVSKDLNRESVAVLYGADNPYSVELATLFKKNYENDGGTVVAFENYPEGAREYGKQLKRIIKAHPEILFLPNNTKKIQIQAINARQLGFKGLLLGGDSWDPVDLLRNAVFNGCYFADHWFPGLSIPGAADFEAGYKKKNGVDATEVEALSYDAIMSLFAAVRYANSTDPVAIRRGLIDMPPYAGVTGKFNYNNNGDPDKDVFISNIKNGKVVLSDTIFTK